MRRFARYFSYDASGLWSYPAFMALPGGDNNSCLWRALGRFRPFSVPLCQYLCICNRKEWNDILNHVADILKPKLRGKLTLEISDIYKLHNMKHSTSWCRVVPKE